MHKPYFIIPLLIMSVAILGQCRSRNETSQLPKTKQSLKSNSINGIVATDSAYIFKSHGKTVLVYNFVPASLPENTDPAFSRSGYIHPLFTPSGKNLTRIQPPDHLHHYGLWNAWTKTIFQNKPVDFWNLGQKTGRVEFIKIIDIEEDAAYSSITALHHHYALDNELNKTVALVETLEIKNYKTNDQYFIIDYTSTFNCPDEGGLLLEEYRYGGFVFRGAENWNPNTVDLITSEGKDQSNSDGERARWCMVSEKQSNQAGILLMSHPQNHNHPEPLRTWNNEGNNGISNIFINFCPIRNQSWKMEKDQSYTLKYRIITFDTKPNSPTIEEWWRNFAQSE